MHKVFKINRLFTILPLFFAISLCFFAITGCNDKQKGNSPKGQQVKLEFAKNFELEQFDSFYKLSIKVFFHGDSSSGENVSQYILYNGDSTSIPGEFKSLKKIKIPVGRIVALSSNYYAYLKAIGEESKVVGFGNKNFTADSALYANIENGKVKDVGSGPTLSEEAVYTLRPDIVLTFATGTGFDSDLTKLASTNIPVLLLSEWQETSALGRMEWIKLFELLSTGTFEGGDSSDQIKFNLYKTEKQNYEFLRDSIKSAKANEPCINTLVGTPSSGTWYAPGKNSFTGKLLTDAKGCTVFNSNEPSLRLGLESAFKQAKNANIWINAGHGSEESLLAAESRVKNIQAFKDKKIFHYDKLKGPSGALDFFENGSVYPSRALRDFIIMLYGSEEQQKTLTWYRNIFYN